MYISSHLPCELKRGVCFFSLTMWPGEGCMFLLFTMWPGEGVCFFLLTRWPEEGCMFLLIDHVTWRGLYVSSHLLTSHCGLTLTPVMTCQQFFYTSRCCCSFKSLLIQNKLTIDLSLTPYLTPVGYLLGSFIYFSCSPWRLTGVLDCRFILMTRHDFFIVYPHACVSVILY